ncbi:MAG TPA: hypothetical protein VFB79_21640 [Candidatus Angelobacter sp.]|nr:hypothetical protein [Candidatus Angelobacter sp.]
MQSFKSICVICIILVAMLMIGCGGKSTSGNPVTTGAPIDPSGNWVLKVNDTSNNQMLLSGLFSQTGSIVTAINILDAGNPSPFSCVGAMSMANGQVLNVSQFSGDIIGGWGTLHFTSTLNDAGTHASGTYTLTPSSNCAGDRAHRWLYR